MFAASQERSLLQGVSDALGKLPNGPPRRHHARTTSESQPSTQPLSAASPEPDAFAKHTAEERARNQGTPGNLYHIETQKEARRLVYQNNALVAGRKASLTFDDGLTVEENANQNVRAYWQSDGVWLQEWDRAEYNHQPFGRWAHEIRRNNDQEKSEQPGIFGLRARHRAPKKLRQLLSDPDASRPYRQFAARVNREASWLRDEYAWNNVLLGRKALQKQAEEAITREWLEWGLLDPQTSPGAIWKHESDWFGVLPTQSSVPASRPLQASLPLSTQTATRGTRKRVSRVTKVLERKCAGKTEESQRKADALPRRSARLAAKYRIQRR